MTKTIRKNLLTALCFTFAVSAFCGAHMLTAKADGEATAAPDFTGLTLSEASVRYADTENGGGISWVLSMDKDAYATAQAACTNVTYGIYIAPKAYYDEHAFNTSANIEQWYSVNTEADGKAFLYEVHTVGMLENDGKMQFRGSLVDIKEGNEDLSYCAVGYVAYTAKESDTTEYSFVDGEKTSSPADAAFKAIENLDATKDATKIENLMTTYVKPAVNQGWKNAVTATKSESESSDLTATGKYALGDGKFVEGTDVTFTFSDVGELTDGHYVVNVKAGENTTRKLGSYDKSKKTVTCTATLSADSKVWLEEYHLGAATVNGKTTATVWMGTLPTQTESGTWVNDSNDTTSNRIGAYYTDKVMKGDCFVDQTITVKEIITPSGSSYGLAVSTGEHAISFHTNAWEAASNKLLVRIGTTYDSQAFITGFPQENLYNVGNVCNFKLMKKDNVLYVYNKNEELIFHIDGTNGIVLDSASASVTELEAGAKDKVNTECKALMSAGDEMAFGMYYEHINKSSVEWNTAITEGSAHTWTKNLYAASRATVNGSDLTGKYVSVSTKDEVTTTTTAQSQYANTHMWDAEQNLYTTANYNNEQKNNCFGFISDATTKKAIVTKGDYVLKFQFNTTSEADLRIYSDHDVAFAIRTVPQSSWQNNNLLVGWGSTAKMNDFDWFSESWIDVREKTGVFANPCNTGDTTENTKNWLDLAIVRSGNSIKLYSLDYLTAEGAYAKHETWTLIFSFTAESAQAENGLTFSSRDKNKFLNIAKSFFEKGSQNAFGFGANVGIAKMKVTGLEEGTEAVNAFVSANSQA